MSRAKGTPVDDATWKSLIREPLRGASAYHVAAHPNAIKLDANESPYPLSRAAMESIARELTTAEVHRYPDAGHYILEDMQDEVIPLIAQFLARTNGSAPCQTP